MGGRQACEESGLCQEQDDQRSCLINMAAALLPAVLKRHQPDFHSVVPFDPARDRLYPFDFTENNTELPPEQIAETERFAAYINRTLQNHQARYGFGGYWEHPELHAPRKTFHPPG